MKYNGWILMVGALCACLLISAVPQRADAQKGLVPKKGLTGGQDLSIGEMLSKASGHVDKVKSARDQAQDVLNEARGEEEQDLVKINCINGKLGAIKGFLKVSEQSYGKLEKASNSGNKEAAKHQYSLISLASGKAQGLATQAQSCAGSSLNYAGDDKVEAEVDPDIAEIDPTNIVNDPETYFRLPEVSPYQ